MVMMGRNFESGGLMQEDQSEPRPGVALSVVVCTRNRAAPLMKVLQHFAALRSEHRWELILVDNNSTDDTAAAVRQAQAFLPNLRYILEQRVGLGAARDRGWREAAGEIIAFTDDDCYPDKDYIDNWITVFAEHPEIGYAGGRILLWDETDIRVTVDYRDRPEELPPYRFIPAGSLQGANMAFLRPAIAAAGGLDPELGAGTPFPSEDVDLMAAAAWRGYRGRFDPRPLVFHHHGRKEEHRAGIMDGYNRGRGAYYIKYILRRDTRWTYLAAWLRSLAYSALTFARSGSFEGLRKNRAELASAIRYLHRPRIR
jgi:GT2 family glycosyltransferase